MNRIHIFILLFLATALVKCTNEKKRQEYVIGFSQCMTDDVWRQAMAIEMNIEASSHENLTILVEDAKENSQLQIKQIRKLIQENVDVLIISPNESDTITPIAEEAYLSGIPTIIVDRKINSENYTSYVGGNSYEIGKMAGKLASSLLPSKATILEVWGSKSTSPAQERHKGFIDGLEISKNFRFLSIEGKWRCIIAKEESQSLKNLIDIDLIYAHNDVMALGVRDYIMEKDSTLLSSIKILGVDGAFGKDAGLEAVSDERLTASFLYPTGGDQVVKIAMKILNGENVDKKYIMGTTMIDKPTAQTLLMQSTQLINYQNRIEQQRHNINIILDKFSILRHSLTTIVLLMSLIILFTIYIYYINRKINRRNRELKLKNVETEKQKQELIFLNEKIKEVNDQKVRFFMNVSHEIKTPLTLIISPLEKWLKNTSESSTLYVDLIRMKRNTDRLLRVINQLLDFRKIERNDILLNTTNNDIVSFTASVKSTFDGIAESKNIQFSFVSNKPSIMLWFDADKIEKSVVNLLSNAFKFTPENGKIEVIVNYDNNIASISVQDNGYGIDEKKLPFIFNRFYSDSTLNTTGTGIGLNLTQEFVKIHGGNITVESVPNKKTTFTITLPTDKNCHSNLLIDEPCKSSELELPNIDTKLATEITSKRYNYKILIVEDDSEIREYLAEELSENFQVLTAENGENALNVLNETPNVTLVLSDVLMPIMNGFELCQNIKTSNKLSDIPVILLTALSEINQRIYGIAEGADDYIQKPFHIEYVKIKIIGLLEKRRQLQKKFMQIMQIGGVPVLESDKKIPDNDLLFLNNFISLLETSYTESDISIEKISKILGVSRVHLHRKIKEISGLSPIDFLRNFRLSKAVELLKTSNHSISEIAYSIGFSSPTYFSKCFKDMFNMTPSEYIENK